MFAAEIRPDLAAGLYGPADYDAATSTVRRLALLHADRLTQQQLGNTAAAVRDAVLAQDLVETATPAQLRAMVVQLSTPELRPAIGGTP